MIFTLTLDKNLSSDKHRIRSKASVWNKIRRIEFDVKSFYLSPGFFQKKIGNNLKPQKIVFYTQ